MPLWIGYATINIRSLEITSSVLYFIFFTFYILHPDLRREIVIISFNEKIIRNYWIFSMIILLTMHCHDYLRWSFLMVGPGLFYTKYYTYLYTWVVVCRMGRHLLDSSWKSVRSCRDTSRLVLEHWSWHSG